MNRRFLRKEHPRLSRLFEKIMRPFQLFGNKLTPLRLLAAWVFSVLALSLIVLLKFSFIGFPWLVNLDIGFYFLAYVIIPVIIFLRLVHFFNVSDEEIKTKKWRAMIPIILFFGVFLSWIFTTFTLRVLPDYLSSIIPIALVIYAYSSKFSRPKFPKRTSVFVVAIVSLLLLSLPYLCAYAGYSIFLNSAASSSDQIHQEFFVSKAAMALTGNGYYIQNLVRANVESRQDFSKFLICGAGACGETSMSEEVCFEKLGFETMKVGFPGEDHAFVEVKINSTWRVIDPGYSMDLVSRSYRAMARINEVGTISYVTGNFNGTFVELTQDYVPTDTVTIRVTRGITPMGGALVTLQHQLRYDKSSYPMAIPGDGFSFHTDTNGTIVIHLGKICEGAYNSEFGKTDPFYQIYVNGQSTDYKVNSTGTGLESFVPVNLSK